MLEIFIFSILIIANAYEIIGFRAACYYEKEMIGDNQYRIAEKMILWKFGFWCERTFGEFWVKPLTKCSTCMASVHGAIPFWFVYLKLYGFHPMAFIYWIFYTITLAGVATKLT